MAIADKVGGCYREDRNLTPFGLQPMFFGRRQGTLDSSQGVKAREPRLTGVEGLRHTLALWAEAWGGLSWLGLLQPDFLELSWKEALLGEAENWSPRVFWIGHIYCTYCVKRKRGVVTSIKREEIHLVIWIPNCSRWKKTPTPSNTYAEKQGRRNRQMEVCHGQAKPCFGHQQSGGGPTPAPSKTQINKLVFWRKKLILQKQHSCSNKNLYTNSHSSITHNSWKMEATQMSINGWINKTCYVRTVKYHSSTGRSETLMHMTTETSLEKSYVEWKKPGSRCHVLYDFSLSRNS